MAVDDFERGVAGEAGDEAYGDGPEEAAWREGRAGCAHGAAQGERVGEILAFIPPDLEQKIIDINEKRTLRPLSMMPSSFVV